MASLLTGVLASVVTPFQRDLSPDGKRLIRHCRWLLEQNCGLAVFGTNSEANSLSVEERIELLDLLLDAGLDPKRMMPGTLQPTGPTTPPSPGRALQPTRRHPGVALAEDGPSSSTGSTRSTLSIALGARMKILTFITDPKAIRRILDHLDQKVGPRAPPSSTPRH